MNETYYAITLLILEIVFSLMVLKALSNAGAKKSMLMTIGVVFGIWLTTVYTLISRGFFGATGMPQMAFSLAVVIPVTIGYLAKLSWKPLGQAVDAMSTETFLLLQHMRVAFGMMFFFTAALPVWFQYIGGLGDIAAGAGAFFALKQFHRNPDKERQAIIRGNLVGILDFIVVFTLGIFVVLKGQSPDMMFDLIPLYVVPIFILLHVFSLQRLGKAKSA